MSFFPHHRFDPFDPFFAFPSPPSPCPVSSSSVYFHRESALFSPPFPFPPLPSSHALDHFSSDLDLFIPPVNFDRPPISSCPYFNSSSSSLDLLDLSDRVSSLELGAYRHCPAFKREVKHTWTTEIKGDRKYKWVAQSKPSGERSYEYEAEVESPLEDGFDRKYKWKAESDGKVKWTKEIRGKGCHEPWAHKYTCEESLYGNGWKKCHKKEKIEEKKKEEKKEVKKEKKEKHSSARVVEIEDSTYACEAMRKVYKFSGISD